MPPLIDRLLRMTRRMLVFLTLFFPLFHFALSSLFFFLCSPPPPIHLIKLSGWRRLSPLFSFSSMDYSYLRHSFAFSFLCTGDNTMRECATGMRDKRRGWPQLGKSSMVSLGTRLIGALDGISSSYVFCFFSLSPLFYVTRYRPVSFFIITVVTNCIKIALIRWGKFDGSITRIARQ